MADTEKKDSNWRKLAEEEPPPMARVDSRIAGQEGYAGGCYWIIPDRQFWTWREHSNRTVLTIWKHDEWRWPPAPSHEDRLNELDEEVERLAKGLDETIRHELDDLEERLAALEQPWKEKP